MKPFAATLLLLLAGLALTAPFPSAAQDFGFEPPAEATDPALPEALRDLAVRLLPAYRDDDRDRYLATVDAMQLMVGDARAARDTRQSLRDRQRERGVEPTGRAVAYDIYTEARALEAAENLSFAVAYARTFREAWGRLDSLEAYRLEGSFAAQLEPLRESVQAVLDRQRGTGSIAIEQALELVRAWFAFEAYRSFGSLVTPLITEDRERRYVFEELAIPVDGDATVAATLVRPRGGSEPEPRPTLLEFTLDRSSRDAREAAAHGYASVLALARIAGDPAHRPRAPFDSDGADARAVIEWITEQPWSDGRVGMHGVGYGGFVAWSAAKRLPMALRAIATSDPLAPGIDFPNRNRVFANSAYRWIYSLLAPPDDALTNDDAQWRSFDEEWYRSGRIYRDYPPLPGRARAIFRSWVNHPSYDRFWQKWLPFRDEFAAIDIPVLTITGYYSPGQDGALYYFTQHHEQRANADHALLIGPFDARSVEHGATASVRELGLDVAARIHPGDARYAWFDYALRGAERPASVSGAINYELAGANEWRHASSFAEVETEPRRWYLSPGAEGAPYGLATARATEPMSLTETVDLRDRSDAEWRPSEQLVLGEIDPRMGMLFVSEPFAEPVDLAGRLRGELDFTINKYDVDLVVMLYELRSHGEYVKLFEPAHTFRASYARDRVRRRLLLAGVRQQLAFESDRLVARRLQAGSRLVLALGVNKRADQQINYGGGGDVSEESIDDAGTPVRIRWHEGTLIEIPSAAPRPDEGAPEAPLTN